MKKFFLITICSIAFLTSKAQTFDETINWLRQKISSNSMNETFTGNSLWPCHYSDGLRYASGFKASIRGNILTTYTKVSGGDVSSSYGSLMDLTNVEICGQCNYCDNILPIRLYFKNGKVNYSDGGSGNIIILFLDWRDEPNLQDRMIRAFNKIIGLTQNKEAF